MYVRNLLTLISNLCSCKHRFVTFVLYVKIVVSNVECRSVFVIKTILLVTILKYYLFII